MFPLALEKNPEFALECANCRWQAMIAEPFGLEAILTCARGEAGQLRVLFGTLFALPFCLCRPGFCENPGGFRL